MSAIHRAPLAVSKAHRGTIFVEQSEVLDKQTYPSGQFVLRLHAPKTARSAEPGTFIHVQCDRSLPLRRPLSMMRVDADEGWVEVLFKVVGAGLGLLAAKTIGDTLDIMGPIGVGFSLEPGQRLPLLIGGGVGIPPMVFLADYLRQAHPGCAPFAALGSEIPFPFDVHESQSTVAGVDQGTNACMALLERWSIANRLASLAGFAGCFHGYTTDLARAWLDALDKEQRDQVAVFACGPTPMLKAVAALAREFHLPCQIALEEYMACGVGGCAGCTVRIKTDDGDAMRRVCVDGPVFDAHTVCFS